jgi:uncharacterized phage protein (TIGR01671 family)
LGFAYLFNVYFWGNKNKMNRTIKFRGKRVDGKGWIYGHLYQGKDGAWITDSININISTHRNFAWWNVIPETVGRFTGYFDKNYNELYHGDTVKEWFVDPVEPEGGFWAHSIIDQYKGCWCVMEIGYDYDKYDEMPTLLHDACNDIEIIGNIHDQKPT